MTHSDFVRYSPKYLSYLMPLALILTGCDDDCSRHDLECLAKTYPCLYVSKTPDCPNNNLNCISPNDLLVTLQTNPETKQVCELTLAFKAMANSRPKLAQGLLSPYRSADMPVETYAYVLASAQAGFAELTPLLELLLGENNSAGLAAAQTDLGHSLESVTFRPILDQLIEVRDNSALLLDNARLTLPSLPIDLDLSLLDQNLPTHLHVDLGGEWGPPELQVLRASSTLIWALVKWLLLHVMKVNFSDLFVNSTADLAALFANNQEFLEFRNLTAIETEIKPNLLAAIDALAAAAPGATHANLLATIEREMLRDQTARIVQLVDVDGDKKFGRGDRIDIAAVAAVAEQLNVSEPTTGQFVNLIDRNGLEAMLALATKLHSNLVDGGAAISLANHLSAKVAGRKDVWFWEALQEYAVPKPGDLSDWVFINPAAYFADPLPLRSLIPAVSQLTYVNSDVDTVTIYDFAIECELGITAAAWQQPSDTLLPENSVIRTICGPAPNADTMLLKRIYFADTTADAEDDDFRHFQGLALGINPTTNPVSLSNLHASSLAQLLNPKVAPLTFAEKLGPPDNESLPLLADGIRPELISSNAGGISAAFVPSVLLRNPSFGGFLEVDLSGQGNDPQPATNQSLNDLIAIVWQLIGNNVERFLDR